MNEETKKEYGTLVAKKSERLVTALYLVTDLMSDNEPIKNGIRKNAVALLSSMNSLSQLDVKDRITEFKMSLRSVTEIMSLLHVAITTGIVSEMNGGILMDGFRALQLVLEKKQPILTKEMLTIDNEESLKKDTEFSQAVTTTSYDVLTPLNLARFHESNEDIRRSHDTLRQSQLLSKLEAKENKGQSFSNKIVEKNISKNDNNIKDTASVRASLMENVNKSSSGFPTSFQTRKHSRREQILALFVKGVDVSIKDIASRIRGCSEKTIQRELNTLLYDNVIERIGEKRWSRYMLR
jgi:hypothetical protein